MARVQLLNEQWEPLSNVDIEMFDLNAPTKVLARQKTDLSGVAVFDGADEKTNGFRAKITRAAGKVGDMSLSGKTHLTVTADVTTPSVKLPDAPKAFPNPLHSVKPSDFELPTGVTQWDEDGILNYWDGTNWQNLGDALPTSDPGGGELWLSST